MREILTRISADYCDYNQKMHSYNTAWDRQNSELPIAQCSDFGSFAGCQIDMQLRRDNNVLQLTRAEFTPSLADEEQGKNTDSYLIMCAWHRIRR